MDLAPVFLFADFACPYSYVTELIVRRRAAEVGTTLRPYSFELFPAPVPLPPPVVPRRAVLDLAEPEGVQLRTPPLRPRTAKAHELARLAREHGVEETIRDALYRAYWEEGRDIGRVDVLTELAQRHGIDPSEAKVVLDIDRFTELVRRERDVAAAAGVTETPTVVVGTGASAVAYVGAQPYAAWIEVLRAR